MKKVGLVLSGGGVRGIAHIGVLKVLDQLNYKFSAISGCSIGALIGAFYSAGRTGAEIEKFFLTGNLYRNFELSFNTLGIKNIKKLEKMFVDFMGTDNFKDLQTPLYINSTNVSTGKEVVFSRGSIIKAIRASIAVPGVFSPLNIKNEYYIDGGVINELPFSILPDEIKHYILVDVSPFKILKNEKNINLVKILQASIKIMQKQIVAEKIKSLKKDKYILIVPSTSNYRLLENEKKFREILRLGEKGAGNKKNMIKNLIK